MGYHIKVENLDFGYYQDLILKDINFWIKKVPCYYHWA